MLPIEPWFNAMTIESGLPARPPNQVQSTAAGRGLRRVVGRGLIALGQALAGSSLSSRTVSVGR